MKKIFYYVPFIAVFSLYGCASGLPNKPLERISIILETIYPKKEKLIIFDATPDNYIANQIYEKLIKSKKIFFAIPKCCLREGEYFITLFYKDNTKIIYNVYCKSAMYNESQGNFFKTDILYNIYEIIALKHLEQFLESEIE